MGDYTGTKSFKSYENDPLATDLTLEVEIDPDSEDGMLINGILLPISEEGTYGPDYQGNTSYEVTFLGEEITMKMHESIPNGIRLPCFIKATKG